MVTDRRQCRRCMKRRPADQCHDVRRFGGGSYKRAGRWYRTTICRPCAVELVNYADTAPHGDYALARVDRYSVRALRRIVHGGDT